MRGRERILALARSSQNNMDFMKHSQPSACLGIALLRYVRDIRPTETQLCEWLGIKDVGKFHVLKKAGLLAVTRGHVRLSPQHLSTDGRTFRFENRIFFLDEDRELIL